MGNDQSSSSHHQPRLLATAAVANYMYLNKLQVKLLHDAVAKWAVQTDPSSASSTNAYRGRNSATIKQQHFQRAMDAVQIKRMPDQDIIHQLFTLWDLSGNGQVPAHEFVLGLTPLACRGESIDAVLSFGFQLMQSKSSSSSRGLVTPAETVLLLKSINATASYFGDVVLGLRQIHRLVDSIFDSVSTDSHGTEYFMQQFVINKLLQNDHVQRILENSTEAAFPDNHSKQGSDDHQVANFALEGHKGTWSVFSGLEDDYASKNTDQHRSVFTPSLQDENRYGCGALMGASFFNTRHEEDSNMDTSDVSSVILSPLTELPALQNASSGEDTAPTGPQTLVCEKRKNSLCSSKIRASIIGSK